MNSQFDSRTHGFKMRSRPREPQRPAGQAAAMQHTKQLARADETTGLNRSPREPSGRDLRALAWFIVVLPALLLNYFGQGALIISRPGTVDNPFFRMVDSWALYPLVLITTAATIIASQALISGSYSLTMQAVQLGYAPRMTLEHTSAKQRGQIYIRGINWTLMIACIGLVLGFRTSSNLAAAYGVAVTTTMVVTSLLFFVLARDNWRWRLPVVVFLGGSFLLIDLVFWGSNLLKILHGGWFPLLIGGLVFTLLTTWKRGRQILAERMSERILPQHLFIESLQASPPVRVPGTAVYMSSDVRGTPPALLHNLKHNKVLHDHVIFLSVVTEEVPLIAAAQRSSVERMADGLYRVVLHYGFMEDVDVPDALAAIDHDGLEFAPMNTTYFLGRETLLATKQPGMAIWREKLFSLMSRNARNAASYFRLPPNRVVELGAQVEL